MSKAMDEPINLLVKDCCFWWFTDGEICGKGYHKGHIDLVGVGEFFCKHCSDYISVEVKRQ